MKNTILILLLSIATNLMAQKDTLYYKLDTVWHTNWLPSSKKDAEFYRPMPLKKVGNLYQIKDYYIKMYVYFNASMGTVSNGSL